MTPDRSVEERLRALEGELARRRRGSRALHSLAAALALTALAVPLALAGEAPREGGVVASGNERGEPVEIGLRNRSDRETGLIASGDGYSLRLSNVNRGEGGGAIFGCRAAASAEESCVNADNLVDGQAFFFRSREGSSAGRFQVDGPNAVPFTTNARGLVANLNAEMVGGLTAQQLIAQASGSAPADPVPGAQGPQGPQGPAGPAGPPGPAELTYVERSFTLNAGFNATLTAECPEGTVVTGGGLESSDLFSGRRLRFDSRPWDKAGGDPDDIPDDGWAARIRNEEDTLAADATVYAICAPAGSVSHVVE